ncbi:trichohyalin-like isoform X6 [Hyla sarda]|uniref:trichohyalin-like isoform X6 n=1 Tax=Hyla sarda TaxID=327740 RepID=UPI0024C3D762|nr:trichohyalin-like isoform X6 [Hyla sarda]
MAYVWGNCTYFHSPTENRLEYTAVRLIELLTSCPRSQIFATGIRGREGIHELLCLIWNPLHRGGTEAMYMEKEDLLQKILELESEKREVGSDPRHRDPIRDTMSVTEETPRRAQEEASIPHVVESKQEDNNMGQRLVRNQECEGCCRVYARILQHLERRAESEQRLREEELALRREELQLQRERAALERERQEAERKERERRFELEREERQVILEILREKMIK